MANRKRQLDQGSSGSEAKKGKRQVTLATFHKWQKQYEREHRTLSWLRCDVDSRDKSLVQILWCDACRNHEKRLTGLRNFSRVWITGSNNHKTSNIIDHAKSEQHHAAMIQAAKASHQPITSYSPLARSFTTMEATAEERVRRKFDICYVLAKEGIAFHKYPSLHALEERHCVDLGFSYKTKDSAKTFTHYIAESQRQSFLVGFPSSFFSFLMDGSTDAGNVEDELVFVQYCIKDDASKEIRSCTRYLSLEVPQKADADGLIACLGNALGAFGVSNILQRESVLGVAAEGKPIVVGGGTDGASVNISGQNGMRGKLCKELPWLYWMWCYAHRLELACKDACTSQLCKDLQDVLLRLYYLYAKSPKKCRELSDIVDDLKEVWELSAGGSIPVRSQGSRWICHKRKALQRVVDRYGAYLNHLSALIEDHSINSSDRARLRGYTNKWKQAKVLIGAAMYVDVLKAPSLLSLSLQDDILDIVQGIKQVLSASKALKAMACQDPLVWPTVQLVCNRIKEDKGHKVYQGSVLGNYSPAVLKQCADEALSDIKRLEEKLRERLEWSDMDMLRAILAFLDTQNWRIVGEEGDSLADIRSAVEVITTHFRVPLEAKEVDLCSIQDEVEEAVQYARNFLNVSQNTHRKVWYQLHTVPDSSKWPSVLELSKLLFSLPFSNAHVERAFSTLKVIKTERRTNLKKQTLSDLLEIKVEGPPLAEFSPNEAVKLWWEDCQTTRRVNQAPRKQYRPRDSAGTSSDTLETEEQTETVSLEDWDKWI